MSQTGQPGVLPLRPLTVGELIDAAFTLLRARGSLLVGLGAAAAAAEQAVLFPLRRLADLDINYRAPADKWSLWLLVIVVGFALEAAIIAALAAPASATAPRALLGRAALARRSGPPATGRNGAAAGPRSPAPHRAVVRVAVAAVVVAALCGLAMAPLLLGYANVIVLVLLVPLAVAIWVWVYGSVGLTVPAVVIDRLGPVRALGRSIVLSSRDILRTLRVRVLAYLGWFLIRIAWWYGVLALVSLVYVPPNTVMDNVLMAVVFFLVNSLAYPMLACLDTVLHLEARMRTEGLDIALRRTLARGVDPYPTLARA